MIKANLTLRYTLYSYQEDIDIFNVSEKLPSRNREGVYALGTEKGKRRKFITKQHTIDYVYQYQDISSINEVCQDFYHLWSPYKKIVKELHINGEIKSFLLFEFVIKDFDFPELCYENSFLFFLAEMGIELQFYFYTS